MEPSSRELKEIAAIISNSAAMMVMKIPDFLSMLICMMAPLLLKSYARREIITLCNSVILLRNKSSPARRTAGLLHVRTTGRIRTYNHPFRQEGALSAELQRYAIGNLD